MLLGISSFSYGWSIGVPPQMPAAPLSAPDLVARTVDFGLTCLQIGDNLPLHTLADSARRELKMLLTKHGIRLEVGARGLTEKHLQTYIEVAAYYDAPLLRFVTDLDAYAPNTNTITEILQGALPGLHDAGLTLGIENHDRFKAADLSAVLRSVGDSTVGICLDTVNSLGAGEDVDRIVDALAPYTVNLHIKDYTIVRAPHKMGFVVTGAPAGRGMLNIPALLKRLASFGRCQSAVLEQWVTPDLSLEDTIGREVQWAIESIQYLKRLPEFAPRSETVL
jgi:sugar phosphate isomerase/epimerase